MLSRSRFRHPCARESHDELQTSWDRLTAEAGARRRIFGRSRDGRPLVSYELGDRGPRVLLTASMHGIEIIGALALREVVRAFVQRELPPMRLSIAPILNPDALATNLTRARRGQRAWQRGNAGGVDLNRNFPSMTASRFLHPFAGSSFRLAPHYGGPHAFSEPETRALRDLVTDDPPRLHLGFHSFGNLLLYPWAFTDAPHPRRLEYEALCHAFNGAVSQRYEARQAQALYPTIGDLDDWLDATFDTRSLTVEVGRPSRRLLHPRRLSDPFHWMNCDDADRAIDDLVPGVLALLSHATREGADRPRPARAPSSIPFDL
ncbi:MAG: succinylglutamate desuccinylase/aspartoacylase family protein, partial [Myxococcales bacterium]|nr:succinylglutamate desuccinylase/aspartoacylase family protein [Myxococcales bacterium]